MNKIYIYNWEFIVLNNKIQRLSGQVINHPSYKKDEYIKTSRIVCFDIPARKVKTKNSIYYLVGEPSKGYLSYLKKHDKPLYYQLLNN